jgi:NitT/TauT family transport system ATP-binding protein
MRRHHAEAAGTQLRRTWQGYGGPPTATTDPSVRSAAVSGAVGIEVDGVTKSFGNVHALAPVDVSVGAGEVVTILGPSGSGKTTLLRIVAGLDEPTAGRVTIGGASPHDARKAKRIGFVPQSPALLPWRTVGANARLLLDVNRSRSTGTDPAGLLAEVGLADFTDAYPHELSGGMQQRVALVRAMALGAPLLLMDEPFAALDEITRTDMRHLLARLCERVATTVLFVTHSIAEAVYLSDRVLVFSKRPARIALELDVDIPYPRTPAVRYSAHFNRIEEQAGVALGVTR